MIEIYSVESRKGGVGKTTIALNLAKVLERKKYDVLLIDCGITGTPITKAAWHSPFWRNNVVAAFKGHPDMDGNPFNLISYYKIVYLKGKESDAELLLRHETLKGKIHLIGSDIYDEDGQMIIDPRELMDDLHSYWFLDMIKTIVANYSKDSTMPKQAIVLDNSPGYVGIGKCIREWLTSGEIEKTRFVLVSSLDEQDIASTISSAKDIERALPNGGRVDDFVKIVINKVLEELLEEGSGYKILPDDNEQTRAMVKMLFPLDAKKYPKNIVKYDRQISGQFIEASLLPKRRDTEMGKGLETAFRKLEKKIYALRESRKPYTDITYLSSNYHFMLRELTREGYCRMSQTLASEEFLPEIFIKNMSNQVGQLGSMAHPNPNVLKFSKNDIREMEIDEMERFIAKNRLDGYYPLFMSLLMGLMEKAGIDRKDANIFQLVNLAMMLRAFYAVHDSLCEKGSDYRLFLKNARKKIRKIRIKASSVDLSYEGLQTAEFNVYGQSLLNAYFKDFLSTLCYTLMRVIDCESDYALILKACRETIAQDAKMMSERLATYLKRVVYGKTEDQDDKRYHQLVIEPFDMKAVQRIISKHVIG